MATTLIKNIKQLVNIRTPDEKLIYGSDLSSLPTIGDAYIIIEDKVIAGFGNMKDMEAVNKKLPTDIIDATGRFVMPAWCDSHTHLVFAGSRESEFVDKIRGASYSEINAKGGGILNSAQKLNDASEDELFLSAWKRLEDISRLGTGAVEIKSGYGLSVAGELKMLRVIKKLKEKSSVLIRTTFLGAHTYPQVYKEDHQSYINSIINEMLPVIAADRLADYIDVFCETGFFSPGEMETIVNAGEKLWIATQITC